MERGDDARDEVPRHAREGRGLRPAGPARGREPPARPRPRGQHEHAARHAPDHRRAAGRGGHRDVPLQLPVHGARQGPRLAGRLHGDRPLGGRGGTRGRPRPPPPGRRPLLRRAHDFDGGLGIAARWRARPGLLLVPAPPARQAGHEAGRPPRGGHGPDALPQRDARRAGGPGPAQAGLQEARRAARRSTSLDTADHGFKILKKSRTSEEDVFVEMARVVREWAANLASRKPG